MHQGQNNSPQQVLARTLLPVEVGDVLELDELWSFVGKKSNVVWIWVALCRRTRQVVAWTPGDRSYLTCRNLWSKIPLAYRQCTCFTDFWEAYQKVIPDDQHRPCAKQEGQTNHVERFNLTLRQRLARLTRKTLAFSKCPFMHIVVIRLFLLQYNLYCIERFCSLTPLT